jgi:excisionase family DNA binding protein
MEQANEFITAKEAAKLFGVCQETVDRRIRDGSLPAYRTGLDRRVRWIRREDLDQLARPRKESELARAR